MYATLKLFLSLWGNPAVLVVVLLWMMFWAQKFFRYRRSVMIFQGFFLGVVTLSTIPWVPDRFLLSLESTPLLSDARILGDTRLSTDVWVLGASHAESPELDRTGALSVSGYRRVAEGVRVFKELQAHARIHPHHAKYPRLILSGGAQKGHHSEAEAGAVLANLMGVHRSDILILQGRNTKEETQAVRALGSRRLVVVSSAFHLRRVAAYLSDSPPQSLLDPVDFKARFREIRSFYDLCLEFVPSYIALEHWWIVIHEWVGLLEARLSRP